MPVAVRIAQVLIFVPGALLLLAGCRHGLLKLWRRLSGARKTQKHQEPVTGPRKSDQVATLGAVRPSLEEYQPPTPTEPTVDPEAKTASPTSAAPAHNFAEFLGRVESARASRMSQQQSPSQALRRLQDFEGTELRRLQEELDTRHERRREAAALVQVQVGDDARSLRDQPAAESSGIRSRVMAPVAAQGRATKRLDARLAGRAVSPPWLPHDVAQALQVEQMSRRPLGQGSEAAAPALAEGSATSTESQESPTHQSWTSVQADRLERGALADLLQLAQELRASESGDRLHRSMAIADALGELQRIFLILPFAGSNELFSQLEGSLRARIPALSADTNSKELVL